jgi:hypothetical protein
MVYEERTYELYPKKVSEFLDIYEKHGLAIHTRVLGRMIGYFTTDSGVLNSVVHLWAFDGFDDRRRRRDELNRMPEWSKFVDMATPLIIRQTNRMLLPTTFSPLQ